MSTPKKHPFRGSLLVKFWQFPSIFWPEIIGPKISVTICFFCNFRTEEKKNQNSKFLSNTRTAYTGPTLKTSGKKMLSWSGKSFCPKLNLFDDFAFVFQPSFKWPELLNTNFRPFDEQNRWRGILKECKKQFKIASDDLPTYDDKKKMLPLKKDPVFQTFFKLTEKFTRPKPKFNSIKISKPSLLVQKRLLNPLKIQCANYSSERSTEQREIPKLLYVQNPIVWAANKLDFRYLRTSWDADFTEEEFTKGARQAISRITQLLSQNMFDTLKPLFTKSAMINVRRDVEVFWANEVRQNISLEPEDIQLIIPRKLHFRHNLDKKFCDIDVVFIAMKYLDNIRKSEPPLVFIDIIARFHRNYSEGIAPDWTVSAFKLRRFNVFPPK